jgi:hypothetical protein
MELIPLGLDFGVEVRGLDVIDVAADGSTYQTARALFEEHSPFRDQQMSGEIQAAFARVSRQVRQGRQRLTTPGASPASSIITGIMHDFERAEQRAGEAPIEHVPIGIVAAMEQMDIDAACGHGGFL